MNTTKKDQFEKLSFAPLSLAVSAAVISVFGGAVYSTRNAYAGSCTMTGATTTICSDPANATADITQNVTTETITTQASFGIDTSTSGGNAITITSSTSASFIDSNMSSITGATNGISINETLTGDFYLNTTGTVTGGSGTGVYVNLTGATAIDILANNISGATAAIDITNQGSGSITTTASGIIDGDISVQNNATSIGSNTTIDINEIQNGGINVSHTNANEIDITLNRITNSDGIVAVNNSSVGSGGDTTITINGDSQAFQVPSGGAGINVDHSNANRGNVIINLNGDFDVSSPSFTAYGIIVDQRATDSNNGDVTVNQAADTTLQSIYGVLINNSSGATTIDTQGTVNGTYAYDAIRVNQMNGAGAVSISSNDVTGYGHGITVNNDGTGATEITITGTVTASGGDISFVPGNAIQVDAGTESTDITIMVNNANGADHGLYIRNNGTGSTTISTTYAGTGAITGRRQEGIDVVNAATATSLTVAVHDVTGSNQGILARNNGTGATSIASTGTVTGEGDNGIDVENANSGTSLSVSANNVTGANHGIQARNYGSGSLTVTASGSSNGDSGNGINAINGPTATDATVVVNNASGTMNGVLLNNQGSGSSSVTINGIVTGGTGVGLDTLGADVAINVNSGANISSASGLAIQNDGADSVTTIASGATVTGRVELNDGSDRLTLNGSLSNISLLDGGDDTSSADGFIDVLQLNNFSSPVDGSILTNWERIIVNGGTFSLSNGSLTVGSEAGLGLFLTGNSTFEGNSGFTLNGNLDIASGSTLEATGGGSGVYEINGSLNNNGTVNLSDGAVGDVVTVNGDYSGSGELSVDVDFALDQSDRLVINGDIVSGTATLVNVNDITTGVATGNLVPVVDVTGAAAEGNFALANGPIVSGAFFYDFALNDRGFALVGEELLQVGETPEGASDIPGSTIQASYLPQIPTFEVLPQLLLSLNGSDTLQQREAGFERGELSQGMRIRVQGNDYDHDPAYSATGANFDINGTTVQLGGNALIKETEQGTWAFGGYLENQDYSGTVNSAFGGGDFDQVDSFGGGLTATWYGNNEVYADFHVAYKDYDIDATPNNLRQVLTQDGRAVGSRLVANNGLFELNNQGGNGQFYSVEVGKRYESENYRFIPQGQLSYSKVDVDDFEGFNGEVVSIGDGDRVTARLGLSVHKKAQEEEKLLGYALSNVYYRLNEDTQVNINSLSLDTQTDRLFGEVGLGASYRLNDRWDLKAEARALSSLENLGDDTSYTGTLLLEYRFKNGKRDLPVVEDE